MFLQYILISCVSTSCMTLFSYGMAAVFRQQFREPKLLNILAIRLKILNASSGKNHPVGWVIHYVIGVLFVALIEWIRETAGFSPLPLYYIVAGTSCGLIGVVMWFITFRIHPNPPKLRYRAFYIQLILAHITFGLALWCCLTVFA
jgi:hypothetical protein